MTPAGDRLAAKPEPGISHLGLSQSASHMQEMLGLSPCEEMQLPFGPLSHQLEGL